MRVLKPVLLGSSDSVEISSQAEHNYVWKCQNALRTLVWHKGSCTSVSHHKAVIIQTLNYLLFG